jgi:hypothetical protein
MCVTAFCVTVFVFFFLKPDSTPFILSRCLLCVGRSAFGCGRAQSPPELQCRTRSWHQHCVQRRVVESALTHSYVTHELCFWPGRTGYVLPLLLKPIARARLDMLCCGSFWVCRRSRKLWLCFE